MFCQNEDGPQIAIPVSNQKALDDLQPRAILRNKNPKFLSSLIRSMKGCNRKFIKCLREANDEERPKLLETELSTIQKDKQKKQNIYFTPTKALNE